MFKGFLFFGIDFLHVWPCDSGQSSGTRALFGGAAEK